MAALGSFEAPVWIEQGDGSFIGIPGPVVGAVYARVWPDEGLGTVQPVMFGGRLCFAEPGCIAPLRSYDRAWCYKTVEEAIAALKAWNRNLENEPDDWHRAIHDGRRRPDGDASKEYTRF